MSRHRTTSIRTPLAAVKPIVPWLRYWGIRTFAELPKAARGYVERLSEACACEIGIVSTGPDRTDTILRPQSAIASWFD
jgi:adenylosuccinate synthase